MGEIVVHLTIDDMTIDPVWWSANIYDGEQAYNESLARFSPEQRLVFAIFWHQAEVNNGGHDQFYYNSTGIVWRDALQGYNAVGRPDVAAILEESAVRMGGAPSLDRETRWKQLDDLSPDFDDLDTRFYQIEQTRSFDPEIIEYIKAHRAAFYFDGDVKKWRPDR